MLAHARTHARVVVPITIFIDPFLFSLRHLQIFPHIHAIILLNYISLWDTESGAVDTHSPQSPAPLPGTLRSLLTHLKSNLFLPRDFLTVRDTQRDLKAKQAYIYSHESFFAGNGHESIRQY